MRNEQLRLSKCTKATRRIAEILKKNKIKFKVRRRIGKYEVDLLIGKVALEIDGNIHDHINQAKDIYLFSQGFVPIHLNAYETNMKAVEKEIIYLIKENNDGRIKTRR